MKLYAFKGIKSPCFCESPVSSSANCGCENKVICFDLLVLARQMNPLVVMKQIFLEKDIQFYDSTSLSQEACA